MDGQVLAVLAGATSYQKIITFIAVQRDRLNAAFGACSRRAPAVNTLRSLFLALDRDDLEGAFRRHARELNRAVQVTGKRTIALDGKTLRGSFDHLNDRAAAHVLSAFGFSFFCVHTLGLRALNEMQGFFVKKKPLTVAI